MPLNIAHTRERLQKFEFAPLFVEELGWSNPASREAVSAQISTKAIQLAYTRKPIAQLSGVAVLEVTTPHGIPDVKARAAIAKDVAEHHVENLLIFLDGPRTQSLWCWVKREAGKAHARDHLYVRGQPGEPSVQGIAFSRCALQIILDGLHSAGDDLIHFTRFERNLLFQITFGLFELPGRIISGSMPSYFFLRSSTCLRSATLFVRNSSSLDFSATPSASRKNAPSRST